MKKPGNFFFWTALVLFVYALVMAWACAAVKVSEVPFLAVMGAIAAWACGRCWKVHWAWQDKYQEWKSKQPKHLEEK